MRRPRKATGDAHISGYTLPSVMDEDWDDLERIAGVQLNDEAREAVQHAAIEYTEHTLLQQSGGVRSEMLGQVKRNRHRKALPLENFRKALHDLVAAWTQADQHTETARLLTDFAAEIQVFGKMDFEETRGDLETMASALDHFLSRMEKGVSPTDDPLYALVQELSKILTNAGGRVSAATLTNTSKRVSPFVAFVTRVNDIIPDNAKRHHVNDAAWSKAVARALRD